MRNIIVTISSILFSIYGFTSAAEDKIFVVETMGSYAKIRIVFDIFLLPNLVNTKKSGFC